MCKGNGYRYEHLPDIPNKPLRQRMVVLSGAGISAESGLSTFRDTDGLWKNYNWERLASIDGFYEDPKAVLDFYNMRRKRLNEVAPNHTHKLLAELEKWHDVTIITQNVDNLHERAGSSKVIHLHGELTKARPENRYNDRDNFSESCVINIGTKPIHLGDKAPNGAQLRPHIVWFGEAVPKIEEAIAEVETADILLIVGTSMQVYPAAGLLNYVRRDVPIYLIDPKPVTTAMGNRIKHLIKGASEGVEEVINLLKK